MKQDKCRLCIDFKDRTSLILFLSEAIREGVLPDDCAAYHMDGLDVLEETGIPSSNSYIVRKKGERPDDTKLKLGDYQGGA